MKKSDLIERLALAEGITSRAAQIVVETALESMAGALENGGRVEIRGFGSFTVREYEGYTGHNPKTGGEIEVEGKKLPFFRVGKELWKRVNNGEGGP